MPENTFWICLLLFGLCSFSKEVVVVYYSVSWHSVAASFIHDANIKRPLPTSKRSNDSKTMDP